MIFNSRIVQIRAILARICLLPPFFCIRSSFQNHFSPFVWIIGNQTAMMNAAILHYVAVGLPRREDGWVNGELVVHAGQNSSLPRSVKKPFGHPAAKSPSG